jgi:heparin binding hemagglutinin HbhA
MSQPKTNRIPAPVYAAAGASELAYRQLLKLPTLANELSGKAAGNGAELRGQVEKTAGELRERAIATTAELRERAAAAAAKLRSGDVDVERLREVALRNAAAFVSGAQAASERANAVYTALVARGERVVGSGVLTAADTVNADMEATEAPAELTAKPAPPAKKTAPATTTAPTTTAPATSAARATSAAPAKKAVAKKTTAPKKAN